MYCISPVLAKISVLKGSKGTVSFFFFGKFLIFPILYPTLTPTVFILSLVFLKLFRVLILFLFMLPKFTLSYRKFDLSYNASIEMGPI